MPHLATGRLSRVLPALIVVAVLAVAAPTAADPAGDTSATETVRRHFESVLALLKSRAFRELSTEKRRAELRRVSDRMFAWDEMARRSLGVAWKDRDAGERRSFTHGFVRLVERFYLGRLEDLDVSQVSDVPIRYLGEATAARETVVETRLVHRRELPVNFRMVHRAKRWLVVDLEVDGISVVDNYRAQFARVVARDGYPALVERVEDRANALRDDREGGASP
jgi:phospholipid transport system substrate-binding protein